MVNEVLCKFLCHNLTCLIQEQETLGITPVFWKDEQLAADEKPAILPMVAQEKVGNAIPVAPYILGQRGHLDSCPSCRRVVPHAAQQAQSGELRQD